MDSNDVNTKLLTLVRAGEFKCCLAGSNDPLTCEGICECLEKEMTLPGFTKNAEMVQCKAVDFGPNFCRETTCSKEASGMCRTGQVTIFQTKMSQRCKGHVS